MRKYINGFIIGIIFVPAAFYIYCVTGSAPVATSSPPMPFERFFARAALHATIGREAPKTQPAKATESELLDGAHVFHHNCAICHGLPGKPKSRIARGEFPPPPQLFKPGEMVTDDPVGVTYWKAKNGIRLTGMPGFGASLSDTQLWDVARLLANADKLSPRVQQALESPPQGTAGNLNKQADNPAN
jgi:thiosulfate dehydrogenase